ncbi:hypothetical protein, partial [Hymenobacter daeguensis]
MKIQLLLRRLALAVPLLGFSMLAEASHFRFGSITFQTNGATNRDVTIRVTEAWRDDAFTTTPPVLGQVVDVGTTLDFGDGTSTPTFITVTTVGPGYFYGEFVVNHTYAAAGNYTVASSSCCRISTLQNNADGNFYFSTVVAAGNANDSPVSTLPPIVNLPTGQATASYSLPSSDPNGNPLTYTAATNADLGSVGFTNAPGLVVSPTGVVTFSTVGKSVGQLYNAVVKVSDGTTSIILDHIIQISNVASNAAPVFTAPTPANGTVYTINPGQLLTFSVRATDADAGDNVNLQALGVPAGASSVPALPTSGNPVQTVFSFTPTVAQLGNYVLSFIAQDNSGTQTTTSVTIQVQANPCNPNANTPVAGTDNFTASCGPLTVTAAQLLANDTSPNGTPLAIGSVGGGGNGTV